MEDVQELLAREAAESVARREHTAAWVEGLDVAPVGEVGADLFEALGVGVFESDGRVPGRFGSTMSERPDWGRITGNGGTLRREAC